MHLTSTTARTVSLTLLLAGVLSAAPSCEGAEGIDGTDGPDVIDGGPAVQLPDAEVRYRTRYIDVAPLSDTPICAGTLALMDAHVEHMLELLELTLSRRLQMYHVHPQEALPEGWCSGRMPPPAGCYSSSFNTMFTTNYSVPHEIVHAVTFEVGSSWWMEGIAHAFSNKFPAPTFGAGWSELHHASGHLSGHLSRWIIERFGGATFMELYERTPNKADQATVEGVVREVLGVEFDDLLSEYAATSAYVYPSHWLCHVPPDAIESPWIDTYWEHEITLDCDQPDTFSDSDYEHKRMTARIPLTLPQEGAYLFLADHPAAELYLQPCPAEPIMEPTPEAYKWPYEWPYDLLSTQDGLHRSPGKLEPGPYVLLVNLPPGEPVTVRLAAYLSID